MVRTCDYPASATTGSRCHFCAVDQGWVMIGGGAEIEGSPSFARLRGSFPYPGNLVAPVKTLDGLETCTGNSPTNDVNKYFTAWMARSGGSSSHRLRAYVVGLQITGLSESQVEVARNIADSTTSAVTQPTIGVFGGSWGTWQFNSIRFNTAGTTLHRPSGGAPVQLMQSTAFPDAGPFRWSLEPFGSGQFRVRNANPNQPAQGECAFRQAGTSNVQVGPCGSGNEFRWTALDGLQGSPFKLRNVASGTCLDNNSSSGNTALRLASCVTGYSDRQSLFLDHFSWP